MALSLASDVRNDAVQALITRIGASGKLKFYNGTRPSGVSAVTGGNTLLATLTAGSVIGTATAGVIDFDEAISQTNSAHVNGTPTFCDFCTSGDVVKGRVDIGAGAGNMQFTGTIATNVNVTLTAPCTVTAGNA